MALFGLLLKHHLERIGMSQAEFARRAEVTQGFVNKVVAGVRKPPIDPLKQWAAILELSPNDHGEFVDAGHLEHSTQHVQQLVRRLRDRVAELEHSDARQTSSNVRRPRSTTKR